MSIQYNVMRNIPPCFSRKMQIAHFLFWGGLQIRRSWSKVTCLVSSLPGILWWERSERHTWSRARQHGCFQQEDGAAHVAAVRRDAPANSPCALYQLSARFVGCQFWTAPSAPLPFSLPTPPHPHVELLSFRNYCNLKISCPSEKCSRDLHSQRVLPVTE